MKKLLLFLAATLTLTGSALATTTPAGWYDNLDQAKKASAETGRPILVLFTGSDWCPPCMALKRNVFEKENFEKYAAANVIRLFIDSPRKTRLPAAQVQANQKVRSTYGVQGYPTVLLLNAQGKKLCQIDDRTLNDFLKSLDKAVKDFQRSKTAAAGN